MSNYLFEIDCVVNENGTRQYHNNLHKTIVGFSCKIDKDTTNYYQFIDDLNNYELIGIRYKDDYKLPDGTIAATIETYKEKEYHIHSKPDNKLFKILIKDSFAADYIEYISDNNKTILDVFDKLEKNKLVYQEGFFIPGPVKVNRFFLPFNF